MKTAAYARYSTDLQSDASIEDQLRNIRRWCERAGMTEPRVFEDRAISGSRADRPGYQALLTAARQHDFEVLLVDDLSRLTRDNVECQRVVRELKFMGVRVVGVSDGIDTDRKGHKIEVGLRGLMSELYIDELVEKIHRGLTGRALAGASAGGLPYGYRVTSVGHRELHPEQAPIVREIFARFFAGEIPRHIAHALNVRHITTAHGSSWTGSAIYGDSKRHIGILVNPIYVGRQIWNRSQWVKVQISEKETRRVRRERPECEWITTDQPDLRIVDQGLWDGVQQRLADNRNRTRANAGKSSGRPAKHLLSGLMTCSVCGGPYVAVDAGRYGCSHHRERGPAVCSNALRVPRADAHRLLLDGVRKDLLSEEAFREFLRGVQSELKADTQAENIAGIKRDLNQAKTERDNLIKAIKAGILTASTKSELEASETRIRAGEAALERTQGENPAQMLPRAKEMWKRWVSQLEAATDVAGTRETLRQILGGPIRLVPENGNLVAELRLSAPVVVKLVAGARYVNYHEPLRVTLPTGRAS